MTPPRPTPTSETTPQGSPPQAALTWGDRLEIAINEWDDLAGIPAMVRMDRAFKRAGVRDLIVENQALRAAAEACLAHAEGLRMDTPEDQAIVEKLKGLILSALVAGDV